MDDYLEDTVAMLKKKTKDRGLSQRGTRAQMIRRLKEDDLLKAEALQQPSPVHLPPTQPSNFPRRTANPHEALLEKICKDNYLPQQEENETDQRRAIIEAECLLKIDQAQKKYDSEMKKAWCDRDEKMASLDQEARDRLVKTMNFTAAYCQLEVRFRSSWIIIRRWVTVFLETICSYNPISTKAHFILLWSFCYPFQLLKEFSATASHANKHTGPPQ